MRSRTSLAILVALCATAPGFAAFYPMRATHQPGAHAPASSPTPTVLVAAECESAWKRDMADADESRCIAPAACCGPS
jgi:hypothetical protein